MSENTSTLKNILKVAFGTLNSRVLGLVRDMLTMAYLGVSAVSSAFIFGFTIPNLFRRMMGEGAFSSAFIPVFSQTLKAGGKEEAFKFLNKALTRFSIILFALVLLGALICFAYYLILADKERYILSSVYTGVMMPYMFLICLAALLCAALNVMGAFTIPSLTAVWLNIAIISSIFIGQFLYKGDVYGIAKTMCLGVIFGGFLQCFIPMLELRTKGWRFRPDLKSSPEISELFKLFLPALLGAAVIQINMIVSNFLAMSVDNSAVSSIYVSNRLVELPMGLFTISIITVYFPKLSMLSAPKDKEEYSKEYLKGIISVMLICLPASVGLFVLSKDILLLLFQWGKFEASDVDICAPILAISAIGIPIYSIATYSAKGFHSLKDTRTPVKISSVCVFINLVSALILMQKFGARGLVAANVISAIFQASALNYMFRRTIKIRAIVPEIFKIFLAAFVMGISIYFLRDFIALKIEGKFLSLITCGLLIPIGIGLYFIVLALLRFKEFSELKKILKRGKNK